MPSRFASGKYAIAECDRCGQRFKLKELKKQEYKAITSLIIKVSSTTFITLFFTYFVCKII